jgi:hypothetical protein
MKKKKNPEKEAEAKASESPSPLAQLAQDFKTLDEEDPLCAKKNDGTD